jgi:hypothetical protein
VRWLLPTILAGLVASPAFAQTPARVQLVWNAPAGCPSAESVLADVHRLVGEQPAHGVVARADVLQVAPEHWSVHLSTDVDGTAGERSLDANSCASLATATALILAWTIDPQRALAARVPRPDAAGPSSPEVQPQAAVLPGLPRSGAHLQVVVAVSAAGNVGMLPGAGLGGQVAVGVLVGPLRLEVAGEDWLVQKINGSGPLANQGARVHWLDVAARGCFRGRLGSRFELDPCLGGGLAWASSSGVGEDTPYTPGATWGVAVADVLASWRVAGPLALRASVGMAVPFARPNFVVANGAVQPPSIDKAAPVQGTGTLGLEVRFP